MTAYRVSYTFTDGGPGVACVIEADNAEAAARAAYAIVPPKREAQLSFCAVGLACERELPPQKRGWIHVTWPPFDNRKPPPPLQLDLFA